MFPFLFLLYKDTDRYPNLSEIIFMATLNGWPYIVRNNVDKKGRIIVIDQGPIYMLTWLILNGNRQLMIPNYRRWWDYMYNQWANTLNCIIYLDTNDKCLLQRIRKRKKLHLIKDKTDSEISKFLAQYRNTYKQVISNIIDKRDDLIYLNFDTQIESLESILIKLKEELNI